MTLQTSPYLNSLCMAFFLGRRLTILSHHVQSLTYLSLTTSDRDPFFMESCPHVYFVGNQNKYESCLLKGSKGQIVKRICILKFCKTGVAVAVGIKYVAIDKLAILNNKK
ncbi:hypothetical protein Scep_009947 [Stephania cephalantha]|uniref:Uncharacterized protein n=1 Tax=Stephania cephalantha TaxID=152367 RepID=A0AAP0JUI6_9MAGN